MPREIPDYQPFYLDTIEAFRGECRRVGVDMPAAGPLDLLGKPLALGAKSSPNRFCAQPISGRDAGADGSPGPLTHRRYRRLAEGGFGVIWVESTIAGEGECEASGRLRLHEGNVAAFAALVKAVRDAAAGRWGRDVVLLLQLASAPGRVFAGPGAAESPVVLTDGEIDERGRALVAAAVLARAAGFDGVDFQACRGALAGGLLGAFQREGRYGGALENRARFLREAVVETRRQVPELLLAARLCAYDALGRPCGFGVDAANCRIADFEEPARLVRDLRDAGLDLLNVTVASPGLAGGKKGAPGQAARRDSDVSDEHPLTVIERQLRAAATLRNAVPGLPVAGSGLSWLRQFLPSVAAGCLRDGIFDLAGLGRAALACPDAPARILADGKLEPEACCMICQACETLREEGGPVGCVIRDGEVYGPVYRQATRFTSRRLEAEARRCHQCEAAPCTASSRTGVDIPGFIKAFSIGDETRAFEIIRRNDLLPELTSRLSPGWLHGEGACIETTLTGRPIPILDLQYAVSWGARERGETGVRLPAEFSGRRVAVVGGGPTGIAAAARLLELGHAVEIFESANALGGVPERVIPGSRFSGARDEIDALLAPAVAAGRLKIGLGSALGDGLSFPSLLGEADAVLLATGLWKEKSLGNAHGVVDALTFLESAKRGETSEVPGRVAVLSGGDCAMDAARTAESLGAREIFIVFGGPRSEMHWHMPEDWFAKPGVRAMMGWQPVGYDVDAGGRVSGVNVRHAELDVESTLRVGLAIEAMGLEAADSLLAAVPGLECDAQGLVRTAGDCLTGIPRVYAAGALVNGGASVARCVAEGARAAGRIHRDLR